MIIDEIIVDRIFADLNIRIRNDLFQINRLGIPGSGKDGMVHFQTTPLLFPDFSFGGQVEQHGSAFS